MINNAKYSKNLQLVNRLSWPNDNDQKRLRVWISRYYMVQEFDERNSIRLSINRTEIDRNGQWSDKIEWDELQEIKRRVGYGESYAIEIYPRDRDIVNVANMRHLWIPRIRFPIGWENNQ